VDPGRADVRDSVPLIRGRPIQAAQPSLRPSRSFRRSHRISRWPERRDDVTDKDRIAGAAKQAKGAVKDVAGKVTGDTKLQAEGKADKAEGKVQSTAGGAKDAARDAMDK